jgi:four helix bundle protein
MKDNVLKDKSFDFATSNIGIWLPLTKQHEYALSKQRFRAGTSVGVNVEESMATISTKDFISKLVIASKEVCETGY